MNSTQRLVSFSVMIASNFDVYQRETKKDSWALTVLKISNISLKDALEIISPQNPREGELEDLWREDQKRWKECSTKNIFDKGKVVMSFAHPKLPIRISNIKLFDSKNKPDPMIEATLIPIKVENESKSSLKPIEEKKGEAQKMYEEGFNLADIRFVFEKAMNIENEKDFEQTLPKSWRKSKL